MKPSEEQAETTGRASRYLGLLVRLRRSVVGWSQEKLAQEMSERLEGVRWYQSTVNRIETGGRTVTWDEAVVLAAVLDFDLTEATPEAGERRAAAAILRHRAEMETAIADYQERWTAFVNEYGEPTDEELDQLERGELTPDELKQRHKAPRRRKR
jgi:ribosome-binding protein aMBF1 (putative translation factor)